MKKPTSGLSFFQDLFHEDPGRKDLEIPDVEPAAVEALVRYIYEDDFAVGGGSEIPARVLFNLLFIGKKYDVVGLVEFASEVSADWETFQR